VGGFSSYPPAELLFIEISYLIETGSTNINTKAATCQHFNTRQLGTSKNSINGIYSIPMWQPPLIAKLLSHAKPRLSFCTNKRTDGRKRRTLSGDASKLAIHYNDLVCTTLCTTTANKSPIQLAFSKDTFDIMAW
jgi:hypothetical protein